MNKDAADIERQQATRSEMTSPETKTGVWGVGNVPWLWSARLRILFVMDGRITVTSGADDFGLGLVLETLRDPSGSYVQYEVTTAHRGHPLTVEIDLGLVTITIGPNLSGFRFTQDDFSIDDYDQVWFFGDEPGIDGNNPTRPDSIILNDEYAPLGDEELRIVAEWMDRGGGVFATGDHSILGASMCHRIPRVRSMRRWTHAQQVPPIEGADRNETLVHGPGSDLQWEGDQWPQRIYPVFRADPRWFGAYGGSPHPILCGRNGTIDHFPDHMHEGALFDDDEVQLGVPLNIPGYSREEYPAVNPVVAAAASSVGPTVGPEAFGDRPRPQIIAYGLTSHDAAPRRFAMVATYDGDRVGLGRVVVDSTWHHWFSYNLVGLRDHAPGHYAGIQDYYRNIALWLARPEQRASWLFAATWAALAGSQPGAFDPAMGIRGVGERVVEIIGRTTSHCVVDDLVVTIAKLPGRVPRKAADDRSWIWAPSQAAVTTVLVGSIAMAMLEEAHHHIKERAQGRQSPFDADAVRRLGFKGLEAGRRELVVALAEASETFSAIRAHVGKRSGRRAK
jgi:hypothetical protein